MIILLTQRDRALSQGSSGFDLVVGVKLPFVRELSSYVNQG